MTCLKCQAGNCDEPCWFIGKLKDDNTNHFQEVRHCGICDKHMCFTCRHDYDRRIVAATQEMKRKYQEKWKSLKDRIKGGKK